MAAAKLPVGGLLDGTMGKLLGVGNGRYQGKILRQKGTNGRRKGVAGAVRVGRVEARLAEIDKGLAVE